LRIVTRLAMNLPQTGEQIDSTLPSIRPEKLIHENRSRIRNVTGVYVLFRATRPVPY
jgi:hypothetical protein